MCVWPGGIPSAVDSRTGCGVDEPSVGGGLWRVGGVNDNVGFDVLVLRSRRADALFSWVSCSAFEAGFGNHRSRDASANASAVQSPLSPGPSLFHDHRHHQQRQEVGPAAAMFRTELHEGYRILQDGGQVEYWLGYKEGNGAGGSGGTAFDLRECEGGEEAVVAWTVQGSAAPAPASGIEMGYDRQNSQADVG